VAHGPGIVWTNPDARWRAEHDDLPVRVDHDQLTSKMTIDGTWWRCTSQMAFGGKARGG
jgi:hypothetical protein